VADLLECLIQIKGVADTPRRLAVRVAALAGQAPPRADADRNAAEVATRMAMAELVFGDCLSRMLTAERPALPALPDGRASIDAALPEAEARALFLARRADTVRVLDRCSAGQLNRIGLEPSRGPMTVADLVAVMLAHDTDCLGRLIPR
jgi:DinB superfamily